MIYQLLSLAGAILILVAFAANQWNLMERQTLIFQLLNLFGGIALCITAIEALQYGFILLEGAWSVVSLIELIKVVRGQQRQAV